ncbi:MAG TPA: polysaccharide deacetylase family protein [Thermoclostridium sp.]
MKKCHYIYWALFAAFAILFTCFASDSLPGEGETYEANSVPASLFNEVTGPDPESDIGTVHTAYADPTPSPEVTPLPSPEPDSAVIPTPDIQVANKPPAEPSKAEAATPAVTQEPSPEPVPVASPTPAPAGTKSEITNPIKSFNDETRICLTFDDGGNQKAVKKALEVLKKHEVKATFFIIGKYLKTNEALWKQAIEEGHLICNHTQNHVWLTQLNDEGVRKEILEWESVAAEIFGQEYIDKMKQEFPFIRLPGGAGNESKRILQIVSGLGYTPVGWNIETYYAVLRHHDLKTEPVDPIADEVFAHVSKKVKGGSIVLLHFNPYDTGKLDEIITAIKEKGLTMHLLPECLEY